MVLSINPIKKEPGTSIKIDLRISAADIKYPKDVHGEDILVIGNIKNIDSKKYLLEITLKSSMIIPCDRCLSPVPWSIEKAIHEELILEGLDNPDELDILPDSGLPILDVVSNYILTEMPMKTLCNDDCKGLCKTCGINLNNDLCDCTQNDIDSRLISLNDFFKE